MTRVLVVEGDPQLLRALKINLHARKFESQEAGTGADALRFAAARTPDVILLDFCLPDMDGIDVIKSIRRWSAVPILVLSTGCTSQEKVHALDTGADDYVAKPFSMNESRRPGTPPVHRTADGHRSGPPLWNVVRLRSRRLRLLQASGQQDSPGCRSSCTRSHTCCCNIAARTSTPMTYPAVRT
ncbi:response regulator [Streptomyces sp. 5.8]|uniref:response regulator n=1 Tax=Streptomyces sp. 5.8 TaxID=3406571 RepID=UPI003BB69585